MPRKKEPEPPWQIIVEEIRSQNRSTIEAVEAMRMELDARIDRWDADSRARDGVLELAIRDLARGQEDLRADVRALRAELGGVASKVDALGSLEPRVTALEQRQPS